MGAAHKEAAPLFENGAAQCFFHDFNTRATSHHEQCNPLLT